jgi:hypothetical protein
MGMKLQLRRLLLLLAMAVALSASSASAQRFLSDDPVLRDKDDLPIEPPGEIELSTAWDVIENSFGRPRPGKEPIPPAQNVNTLGDVPDSSWFTNRISIRPMSVEEIVRGPNRGAGPETDGDWTVIRGKSGGITPGFTIRDSRGDVYFIKVDPAKYFGLSTGADVIGSRFFHAFGYFVPETWVTSQRKDRIRIGEGAKVRVHGMKPRRMEPADLDRLLSGVARLPDGRIRFVASLAVPGKVVGPHKYHGTRPDDPNDVIRHEHRRELRGYRVFCAWLNHDDSRATNSLNTFVSIPDAMPNGAKAKGYLRHYLQDFSSILGSGSDWRRAIAPQNPRAGNEYIIEIRPILKTTFSLGIWQRPWHGVKYEVYPQVGGIEADFFDPDKWKPEYPNPAFERMLPEDAFWAARIVAKFSDEVIRAIVAQADLRAPEAEDHLSRMIIRRRDKVFARYFGALNPLADFRLETDGSAATLTFTNYGEDARLGSVEAYEHQWFAFDNVTGATEPIGTVARAQGRTLPLPDARPPFLMVRIRTLAPGADRWKKRVDVFIRTGDELKVVGIDREN